MKMYVHPGTKRFLDYGDVLDTAHGIYWSMTGEVQDAFSFEEGKTIADVRARFAELPEATRNAVELVEGEPVVRSFDMNPHGLI